MTTITMSIQEHDKLLEMLSASRAEYQRLREALKGTLFLFEGHAASETDLEQIRFARAALQEAQP